MQQAVDTGYKFERAIVDLILAKAKSIGINKSQLALAAFHDDQDSIRKFHRIFTQKKGIPGRLCVAECAEVFNVLGVGSEQIITEAKALMNNGVYPDYYHADPPKKTNPKIKKIVDHKRQARTLARTMFSELIVAYECPCDGPKEMHHPRHRELPMLVFMLCKKHHILEDKRLRRISNQHSDGIEIPDYEVEHIVNANSCHPLDIGGW